MTLRNWLLLLTLSVIWGATFPVAKYAVAEIPPLVLTFLRVFLAALCLHLVLIVRGIRFPVTPRLFAAFCLMGLLNNAIPFSLIFWGQTVLPASLASILNATTPIFTVLVAALLFRQEKLAAHRVAGIVLGFAGVAVLLLPGMDGAVLEGFSGAPLWAEALCLGAALSYAFAASFARVFRGMPVLVSAAGQLTGSSLLMLPLAVLQGTGALSWGAADTMSWDPAATGLVAWVCVIALGVACTALAYLIYFRLLMDAGATNASLVTLLIPVSACLIGISVLGERLEMPQVAGMALLLLGLVVLDGRALAFASRQRRSPSGRG